VSDASAAIPPRLRSRFTHGKGLVKKKNPPCKFRTRAKHSQAVQRSTAKLYGTCIFFSTGQLMYVRILVRLFSGSSCPCLNSAPAEVHFKPHVRIFRSKRSGLEAKNRLVCPDSGAGLSSNFPGSCSFPLPSRSMGQPDINRTVTISFYIRTSVMVCPMCMNVHRSSYAISMECAAHISSSQLNPLIRIKGEKMKLRYIDRCNTTKKGVPRQVLRSATNAFSPVQNTRLLLKNEVGRLISTHQ